MKRWFTEAQIIGVLMEAYAGVKVKDYIQLTQT